MSVAEPEPLPPPERGAEARGPTPDRDLPVRIGIVAPSIRIVGGQSIQADSLLRRLNREPGVEARLIPINPDVWKPLQLLQRVKYARTLLTELIYIFNLLRDVRKCDIVHVFSASYFSFLLGPAPAVLIARWYGRRTILHYHSGEAEDHLRRWKSASAILRRVDRILVPSVYLVEVFARFGLEAEAISNFVIRDHIRFIRRAVFRPVFLANRNLEEIYNVGCVLRAFGRVQARYPDARLIVAGDGRQRRALEHQARELGLKHVEFVGQVSAERMGRLYEQTDIYLNASDVDNMPLSILESFAAGMPVVSTDAGGIPFIVEHGENGMLVDRGDDAGLARAACRLVEEPGLAIRLVNRARADFERDHSWSAVGDDWLRLYAEVLHDPLRLCIVAPSTEILGGQAVQAERLRSRLEGVSNLSVTFLPVNPVLKKPWHWLQKIKYVRTVVTEARYIRDLWRGLRRVDVVHIFSASYWSFMLAPTPALVMARILGRRTILNYRSGEAEDHLTRWKRTAIPTLRLADRIIVGSEYLVEVFAGFGLEASAIPNIVRVERYPFRERRRLEPIVLANRNFEAHYNVGAVLRAFARIQERYPAARLIIAGDGAQRHALERLRDDLELENVEFLGQVEPEEMPALYDRADLYLNASLIDNMPTSLIEAFAAGVPVVTSSAGGIPKIVEHERTGLMVPPRDPEALADAALRLLDDPDFAARMTGEARRECLRRYTWAVVRDQWLAAYRDLALGGLTGWAPGPASGPEPGRGGVRRAEEREAATA